MAPRLPRPARHVVGLARRLFPPRSRLGLAALLTAALALAAGGVRAEPLAVDATAFPQIRLFYPAAEPPPRSVAEDGQPVAAQPLPGPAQRAPLLAALVVDTSGSMKAALPAVQAAADALVRSVGAADRMALIRFSTEVAVLSPPTADRAALRRHLAALNADGATALYDAVWAGVRLVRGEPGSGLRAVFVITDGKDEGEGPPGTPGSAMRLEPLRQELLRAGVPLFMLGLGPEADRDVLESLAAASGGRAAFAAGPEEVEDILDRLTAPLLTARGVRYVSPRPTPDGTRRQVEAVAASGAAWHGAYVAPRNDAILWRWPVAATEPDGGGRRRAACGVGALSPAGGWAMAFAPPTLLRGDGTGAATWSALPEFRPERARVLDDGSGWLFGGAESAAYPAGSGAGPAEERAPSNVVAVAPGGGAVLRFVAPSAGAPARLEAARPGSEAPLWSAPCPGPACDRLAGAAISDGGAAVFNQTGTLYRIGADGKALPPRPEVFFGPVALTADGRLAAAVVWQERRGGPPRAILMDEALHEVLSLAVQAADADLPPVAALAPGGKYMAVLDDTRLMGLEIGAPPDGRPAWRVLAYPAPTPAPCERTLQVDDAGRVLVSDGENVTLLRGFSGP